MHKPLACPPKAAKLLVEVMNMSVCITKAFVALVTESERVGLPTHHHDDLTIHDRLRLAKPDAPERFGWVLRKCGTYLLDATMGNSARRDYMAHLQGGGRCEDDLYYFWDGEKLLTCENVSTLDSHMATHTADGCKAW